MSATTQAPAAYADAPVVNGLSVYTLDNTRLGSVAEVHDAYFRVHVRWRRDFWLARNQVAYVDDRSVGMLFRSDEAELYRLAKPADDDFRRFERTPMPGDGASDANWRGRPLL